VALEAVPALPGSDRATRGTYGRGEVQLARFKQYHTEFRKLLSTNNSFPGVRRGPGNEAPRPGTLRLVLRHQSGDPSGARHPPHGGQPERDQCQPLRRAGVALQRITSELTPIIEARPARHQRIWCWIWRPSPTRWLSMSAARWQPRRDPQCGKTPHARRLRCDHGGLPTLDRVSRAPFPAATGGPEPRARGEKCRSLP